VSDERLNLVAAEVALDLVPADTLPDIAVAALKDGLDSPALRVLAGMLDGDRYHSRSWFDRALAELRVVLPDEHEAVMRLARAAATDIASGAITPYKGAKRIWELTLRVPGEHFHALDPFVYAASEWDDRPGDRSFLDDGIVSESRRLLGL
jgi:hypothetical protein